MLGISAVEYVKLDPLVDTRVEINNDIDCRNENFCCNEDDDYKALVKRLFLRYLS